MIGLYAGGVPVLLSLLSLFVVASAVACLLTFLLRADPHRAGRFRPLAGDVPSPVPLFGGLAILSATSLSSLFFLSEISTGVWTGALCAALVGLVDDYRPFSPFQKLGLQAVAAALAVAAGLRLEVTGHAVGDALLTGVWLVWMGNAFNVLDMMDGLSGGCGAAAALGLAGVSLIGGGTPVAGMAVALAGALGGFLVHNVHPARIYMGDTGSQFVGFLLGGMAVEISRSLLPPQAFLCPSIVLGVPLFEAAFLCAIRTAKGLPTWQTSRDHVAQRLVQMGYSVRGAVGRMYAVGVGLAALGIAGAWGTAAACWAIFGSVLALALWVGGRLARVDMEGDGTDGCGEGGVFSAQWATYLLMRRAMREAADCVGGRLLDVGCGRMPYRDVFAPRFTRYVGMERDRGRYGGRGVDAWGDATALPFLRGIFDTVLSNQVLEHVPEPGQAMMETARVLKPGGHLILTAPHIWGIHEEPHDYYRYTSYGLRYLAGRAGLEVLDVRALAGFWVTAGVRFCYYLEGFEHGLLALPVRVGYLLIQTGALALDRLHRVEGDAWNFLMVARKPSDPSALRSMSGKQ